MKKNIVFHARAAEELEVFDRDVQLSFQAYIDLLGVNGRLEFPDARKVSSEIFEIRVEWKGTYRGFYAYVGKKHITILHFFQKKSQKTPLRNLAVAQQRLKIYA